MAGAEPATMTDETAMNDPERDLDNAALARTLRELLHAAPPAPVDPARRAELLHAAIQRAWPHGTPPPAGPGHDGGHDPHPEPAPGVPSLDHAHEASQHTSHGLADPGHLAGHEVDQPGGPHGDLGGHGWPGDAHGGH
jgi:hypothetical protein